MLRLRLASEVYALIDDADIPLLSGFPWRPLGPNASGVTYVHAWNGRQSFYMHRLVIGAGPEEEVDHADGNGLNNQRANLRIASRGQNGANRGNQRNNARSSFKGVSWDASRNRWHTGIHVNGKSKFLGRYALEEEAARAYDRAALATWGTFARLNFPVDNGTLVLEDLS